jgi:hypothetical protein
MNRRQPSTPPRPPQQQQQQQRQQRQPQQQQQQASVKQSTPSTQYNPNSVNRQLPAQVTIPQAISILVARINQLEDKCAIKLDDNTTVDDSKQMEEMTSRIVKLELELLSAKDHIMKLQSFTLEIAKPQVQNI